MKHVTVLALLLSLCTVAHAQNITLPQSGGTVLDGVTPAIYTGLVIANLGDIDGDYYPDIAVSAPRFGPSSMYGAVQIVKGRPEGFPASISLSPANPQSNTYGYFISGDVGSSAFGSGACLGYAVASLGDRNGDRLNDTVISARCHQQSLFILNGSRSMPKSFRVVDIGVTVPGLQISGIASDFSISTGDFNGDGKLDILVANIASLDAYLINGATLPETGSVTLASLLDGTKAVRFSGIRQAVLADINGDGIKDIVGINNNQVIGIFGKASSWPATVLVNSSLLNGVTGFSVATNVTLNANNIFAIKDVNGDLFEDVFVIGNQFPSKSDAAVLFGQQTWPATSTIDALIASNRASIIRGVGAPTFHSVYSVAPAGDFNNDNIRDFIVGDSSRARAVLIGGMRNWPALVDVSSPDGVNNIAIVNPLGEATGYGVEYAENLYGGIGCGTDLAYLIGAPGLGRNVGKVYIVNIKR